MLEAREISVKFGDQVVIDDISFELADGRILALLGANGAGKTTLLRVLNGSGEGISGVVIVSGRGQFNVAWRDCETNCRGCPRE
ncbi:MAG: ATP-binding cassette domain-containing protein [Pyrinomonadaceae bacterium]